VHSKPLAQLFRAKFRAAVRQTSLYQEVSAATWAQPWVVDCRPVGSGQAALTYLAPYIFRVALSNNRIERLADDQVTFRYTAADTGRVKHCTLAVDAFIRRFLAHVLPKGFVKVHYYGLLRLGKRQLLAQARAALAPAPPAQPAPPAAPVPVAAPTLPVVLRCPSCGQPMQVIQTIPRPSRAPSQVVQRIGQHSRAPPMTGSAGTNAVSNQVRRADLARGMPWSRRIANARCVQACEQGRTMCRRTPGSRLVPV